MEWIADYYRDSFAKLGVEVILGKEATAEEVTAMEPDAVILATGSKSIIPSSIPGVNGANVYTIEEVLTGKKNLSGKSVAMIGAGLTGLDLCRHAEGCRNQCI